MIHYLKGSSESRRSRRLRINGTRYAVGFGFYAFIVPATMLVPAVLAVTIRLRVVNAASHGCPGLACHR